MPRSPAGSWSSSSSGSGSSRWSTMDRAMRPVGGGGDVGEQQPHLRRRGPAPAGRSPRRWRPGRGSRRHPGSGAARWRTRRGRRPARRRAPGPARCLPRGRRRGRSRRLRRSLRTPRTCRLLRCLCLTACPDGDRSAAARTRTGRTGAGAAAAGTRLTAMRIHVADHPLVAHKLTTLRDQHTDSPTFRRLADELVTLLAYEATRDVRVDAGDGHHPGRRRRGREAGQPEAAGRADPAGRARACSTG